MKIAVLSIHFYLPQVHSLKGKRSVIQPILARLHRQFNICAAETGLQDQHQQALLAVAVISNDHIHNEQILQKVIKFIEISWPDLTILDAKIEHI